MATKPMTLGVDQDPYYILGVPPTATPTEVARAYRRQLHRHPSDTNPGSGHANAALQQILAAYAILRNPHSRAAYDRQLPARTEAAPGPPQAKSRRSARTAQTNLAEPIALGQAPTRPRRWIPKRHRGADTYAAATITRVQARDGGLITIAAPTFPVGVQPVRVHIPPGVTDGQTLAVPGHGHAGNGGGPAGDLHLTLYIAQQPGTPGCRRMTS